MNVALYARVSSEKQAEKDLSIKSQLKHLRQYAIKHKWHVVDEFIDEAESARSSNRPAFQRMIALAKQKKPPFEGILVWKLNRFARNREDSIIIKALLRKKGISVLSINEQIDDSPTGKLLEGIIESIDEFYSINLAQDTRRGMKENASRGFQNGGTIPIGYKLKKVTLNGQEKRTYAIDESQAPIVREIFKLCINGEGSKDIALRLNQKGYKTKGGKSWMKNSVAYVLRNEAYTGTLIWNGKVTGNGTIKKRVGEDIARKENAFPAIIKPELFNKAQKAIASRSPKIMNPRAITSNHLLSGLLKCSSCGLSFKACSAKSGKYFYFKCAGSDKGSCKQKALPIEKFERFIVKVLKDRVLTPENIKELVLLVNQELTVFKKESVAELDHFEAIISDKTLRIDRIYEAIEGGKVDLTDVSPRLKKLNEEIAEAKQKKEYLELKIEQGEYPKADDKVLKPYVKDLYKTLKKGRLFERKAFIRSFIKKINIDYPEATIEYTIPLNAKSKNPSKEVLASALNGSPGRTRTCDKVINSHLLYQLSYQGSVKSGRILRKIPLKIKLSGAPKRIRLLRSQELYCVTSPRLLAAGLPTNSLTSHKVGASSLLIL